jgi:hypothetical protein
MVTDSEKYIQPSNTLIPNLCDVDDRLEGIQGKIIP